MAHGLQRVAERGLWYPATCCNAVSIRITPGHNHFGSFTKSTDSKKHINFITAHSCPRTVTHTQRVHRQRRPLQSHVVEISLLSSRRNNSPADGPQSQFAQNRRLVRKANAMRWINYECCNGQWTHASHAIMTQQRHNALASHGFSTRWCPSAGHRALHGPVSTIMHNSGIKMRQSAGHTIYKYTMMYQTQQNFMFIIILRQHVSILIHSSSGASEIQILT